MSLTPYKGKPIEDLPTLMPLADTIRSISNPGLFDIPVSTLDVGVGETIFSTQEGEPVSFEPSTGAAFFKAIGIPFKYADRCPVEVLAPQVKYWLSTSPKAAHGKLSVERSPNGLHASQFLPQGQDVVPLSNVLNTVGEEYGSRVWVRHLDDDSPRTNYVSLVVSDLSWNAALVGGGDGSEEPDLVYGGITIQHSPVGDHPTILDGYLFRLWCSNGAIMREKSLKVTRKIPHLSSGKPSVFLPAIGGIFDNLEGAFNKLAETCRKKAPSLDSFFLSMSALGKKVPAALRARMEELAQTNPPSTYYDLINMLTFLAHEQLDSMKRVRKIESLGGEAVAHHEACTSCGRLL